MAAAHVPPAPSLEGDFDFTTQLSFSSQSHQEKQSYLSRNRPFFLGEINNEGQIKSQGFIQRVPETPLLQQQSFSIPRQWDAPASSDYRLNFSFDTDYGRDHIGLRPVTDIPDKFQIIFKEFTHFNFVQSKVLDDVLYTDCPLVTSAPTGSGKTVIFELAIVRLLMQSMRTLPSGKIIYVAPIKALCSERYEDWKVKFGGLGLQCCELTGDSQLDDYFELQRAHIVMTTPEKWDSMTRKWRDYKSLVQQVQLFLIDEVHQLNDETRGPTMEAIVSRMKTIQSSMGREEGAGKTQLRFIAISATIPNIADVAAWLGLSKDVPARHYSIDESHRPVRLRRVVLGYPDATTEFKFDLALNYRLGSVIQIYSDQKPTLVFCATRKGTQQGAGILVKEARFVMNAAHKQRLQQTANSFRDAKLRELVLYGVGYHHAGMDIADRKRIETMFTEGDLPVLFATSTLAMGVNLPAHLVVIKSTMHYISGMYQECSESQILQMIGRAGRPQFDTTATAVIMTRNSTKSKYEALLNGRQLIESNLHRNLIEHLNAEIVLHTITDVTIALDWLHSTFFYIRVKQNPEHYGMPVQQEAMEEKLQKLCLKNLQLLESCSLVKMDDGLTLQHTDKGRLMARYCVAFESMKRFLSFKGQECLAEMVNQLSLCKEFEDVRLRVNEKKVLNILNKDKNRPTIRFQLPGKIKTTDMKVNCLIQSTLGCLPIQEFALNQDLQKIMRAASRLSKCLMELEMIGENFRSLLNAVTMHKCIQAKLWENSKHVAKQLDKIGLHLSTTLVNAGLTTFLKIQDTGPREIELIMNRHPPFGNQIRDAVALLPCYKLEITQFAGILKMRSELEVSILLTNHTALKENGATWGTIHTCLLLIGDASNKVLCKQRISDSQLLECGRYTRKLVFQRSSAGDGLKLYYISLDHVGVDVHETFTPKYSSPPATTRPTTSGSSSSLDNTTPRPRPSTSATYGCSQHVKPCNHKCLNKTVCGHDCCKNGIQTMSTGRGSVSAKGGGKSTPKVQQVSAGSKPTGIQVNRYAVQLHTRASHLPSTPALNRIKPALSVNNSWQNDEEKGRSSKSLHDRFSYTPKAGLGLKDARSSPLQSASGHSSGYKHYNNSFVESTDKENCPSEPTNFDIESDMDRYLESIIEEEADSYNMNQAFEGDDVGIYSAFSPLGSKEHNSTALSLIQTNEGPHCNPATPVTGKSRVYKDSAKPFQCEKSSDNLSSRMVQTRLPFAGRKRLIDEIFDCPQQQYEGMPSSHVRCSPSYLEAAKFEGDVADSDEYISPAYPLHHSKQVNPNAVFSSQAATELDASPQKMGHFHGELNSMHEKGKRLFGNKLAQISTETTTPTRWSPSPSLSGGANLQGKKQCCTISSNQMDTFHSYTLPQHEHGGPMPCSFFSAGQKNESLDEDNDSDVFGSVFSGIF